MFSSRMLLPQIMSISKRWNFSISFQESYNGKAADIWALGATLYALVFGNVPFLDNSVVGVYDKIREQPLQYPPVYNISAELKDLIEQMLEKIPENRITLPQVKVHFKFNIQFNSTTIKSLLVFIVF